MSLVFVLLTVGVSCWSTGGGEGWLFALRWQGNR